ncbi:MAG: hypothetical protein Q4A21_00780 [bacterium]|nr:hypothetical protein [bacterium]
MEFINLSKKHSLASSISHTLLNILLVGAVWLSIYITKFPFIAIGLVLVSKWRTFAVRPRYWIVNVKSNLVDLIFSIGIVLLMWHNGAEYLLSTAILVGLYVIWLTFLKPQSTEIYMKFQAILAVLIGSMALVSISYAWNQEVVVLMGFLIGYASLRHILSVDGEKNIEIFSLFWGVIVAEMFWLFSFWTTGYALFGMKNFIVPQVSIVVTTLSFAVFEFILNFKNPEKSKKDLLLPIGMMFLLCFILVVFFSGSASGI